MCWFTRLFKRPNDIPPPLSQFGSGGRAGLKKGWEPTLLPKAKVPAALLESDVPSQYYLDFARQLHDLGIHVLAIKGHGDVKFLYFLINDSKVG